MYLKNITIGENSMNFMLSLSKNIPNIKVIVSEFKDCPIKKSKVYYKEHPFLIQIILELWTKEIG